MKTKRERQIDRWRVCGAFLLTLLSFLAMLTGCGASGQLEPEVTPRVVRAATECVKNFDKCFLVHVRNDQYYRAVVKLNGFKLGEVEGLSSESFPVPESRLKNGRCASVQLYLIGPATRGSSDQQCIRVGGYFTVQLDLQRNIWLVPWGGR